MLGWPPQGRHGAAGGTSAAMQDGFFAILPAEIRRFIAKPVVHPACRRPAEGKSYAPGGSAQRRFSLLRSNFALERAFWGGRRHIGGDTRWLFCYTFRRNPPFYSKTRSSWRLSGPRRGVMGRPGTFFCYNF